MTHASGVSVALLMVEVLEAQIHELEPSLRRVARHQLHLGDLACDGQ
jgi:hypothetical protein